MKLLRWGLKGQEKPGLLDGKGSLRDLSGILADIGPEALSPEALSRLSSLDPAKLPEIGGKPRLGPPIARVGKLIGVGLNYTDHARETGAEPPKEPVLFMKATSAIGGPDDDLALPPGAEKCDWEVELGVVIGRDAKNVPEEKALECVAGYCLVNDVSERAWQMEHCGQWVKGKSADGFAPLGPWMVTADEVKDPQNIRLFCEVSGERMQDGTTANMIFPVRTLVGYISRFMTLHAGDVISTGTPAGVGLSRKRFLKAGDALRLGADGLGEQNAKVVQG